MKKKVFNDIRTIARLFVNQEQYEAMTPMVNIDGRGKGRRFYFKGDICYSYRDSFPLARIEGDKVYVKDFCPSNTTKKHRRAVVNANISYKKQTIFSDDLKTPVCLDNAIERLFTKLKRAISNHLHYIMRIKVELNDNKYPITKSKFPILFAEEHKKLRTMLFSHDKETVVLAVKLAKQMKLI